MPNDSQNMPQLNLALDALEDAHGLNPPDEAIYEAFMAWAESTGRPLYPHQEEALLEAIDGRHLIVATPTGSGKSMVALAATFAALARGKTAYYTAPLKALVSEKFFELVGVLGAENVGMQTGDSSINAGAPVVAATAEIVANIALREGADAGIDLLVADEFHFYGDPQRGWAWQVPLLELPDTQHVLLSATLGDTTALRADLTARTGCEVAQIENAERPVPLSFFYSKEPIGELLQELVQTHRSPAYVVHFSQREAVAQAQALQSIALASKEEKEAIAKAIGDFKFSAGFGKTLSKLLRAGIGVHHAGLLPRYRRLVERLAQAGLLKVICGTDTLGVGINVPIRTVVFTALSKFDGAKVRRLAAREFHQIAGRAGRAGFDTMGDVIVQAPEHEIENERLLRKAGDDPKKLKKIVRKKPPEGAVLWSEKTLEHLEHAAPEKLESQMRMSHSLVINLLQRGEGTAPIEALIEACHNENKEQLRERGAEIVDSLVRAEVLVRADAQWFASRAEELPEESALERERAWHAEREEAWRAEAGAGLGDDAEGAGSDSPEPDVRFARDVPFDFALNQPLAPFALAALDLLDMDDPDYALDALSVIESVQEDPRPLLIAQEKKARGEAIGRMKAAGIGYEERMAEADLITWPKPLAEELLVPALATYAQTNPWVDDYELSPKSVVREMVETASTFTEMISKYDAARSEGIVLRYLTDTYKALRQTVPESARTDELDEITDWLGKLVRSVDSSLLDEWEALRASQTAGASDADDAKHGRISGGAGGAGAPGAGAGASDGADSAQIASAVEGTELAFGAGPDGVVPLVRNRHALRTAVRNAAFVLLEALEREDYDALDDSATDPLWPGATVWDGDAWADATDAYYDEFGSVGIGAEARSAKYFRLIENPEPADYAEAGFPDSAIPEDAGEGGGAAGAGARHWLVRQTFEDGTGDIGSWGFWALVDLAKVEATNSVRLEIVSISG